MNISNYRKDIRSKEQFQKDIKYGNEAEKEIINIFKENIFDKNITIVENGCGMDGELLDENLVSTKADYLLDGSPLEVKFNNNICNVFHIKESQLNSYIKQEASILWVNGYKTNDREYIILNLDELKNIKKTNKTVTVEKWGGKKAKRLYRNELDWKKF